MIAPVYYDAFRCVAGACRHNCCIGWEIDIDEETAAAYRALPRENWGWLQDRITGDPPHFVLDAGERCPCLTESNLCRLILELGEDALCEICRYHPRFRSFWPGREEIGLGACCEEAARLILSQTAPLALIEDSSHIEDPAALALFELREKLFSITYDPGLTIPQAEDALLSCVHAALPPGSAADWAGIYLQLERLDEAWTARLQALQRSRGDTASFRRRMASRQMEYRHMLAYFLYRHIPEALEDGDAASRAAFAVLSCRMLQALGAAACAERGDFTFEDQTELFRMYSAEIEYSEENLETLYELLWSAAQEKQ